MTTAIFPFRFQTLFQAAALPVGIRSETAWVEIADDELDVRFGPWRVRTPLSNVASADVTGPYSWPKVIGPPHLSLKDRGLTLATNSDEGVCIHFGDPVTGIDPWGIVRHPAMTVTVEDAPALAELLDRSNQHIERVHADAEHPTVDDLVEAIHDDLRSMTAAELRRRARDRGLSGVSSMSKAELIEQLEPEAELGRDARSDFDG